jgi:hypothetical protein
MTEWNRRTIGEVERYDTGERRGDEENQCIEQRIRSESPEFGASHVSERSSSPRPPHRAPREEGHRHHRYPVLGRRSIYQVRQFRLPSPVAVEVEVHSLHCRR